MQWKIARLGPVSSCKIPAIQASGDYTEACGAQLSGTNLPRHLETIRVSEKDRSSFSC